MKKIKFFLIAILIAFLYSSCDFMEGIIDINLTEEQKQEIIASVQSISTVNDSILKTEDPIKGFRFMKNTYLNDPLVEKVELNESGLYIKYIKGGVVSWLFPTEDEDPPYWKGGQISQPGLKAGGIGENTVANDKVAILNQQSNDEDRDKYLKYYDKAEKEFTNNEFKVNRIDADDITIDFLRSGLKNYGTSYIITHGGYSTDNTWILSGEEASFEELLENHESEWENNMLSISSVIEKRDGEKELVSYYQFSEDFISESYSKGDFPNSFIYLTACQALKNTSRLADAFIDAGCGVFVGWNETNSRGKHTGQMLFDYLLSGKVLSTSIDELPKNAKIENRSRESGDYTAKLVFYPEDKTGFYLVSEEVESDIFLTSHENKEVCSNRVQTISGYVYGVESLNNAVIEINGIPLEMKIHEMVYFSQTVVLNEGENMIKIITKGNAGSNKISVGEMEFKLKGDFPPLDLFTELRWNTDETDIDLHLLAPDTSVDDIFTSKDCYFDNKSTGWNAFLDVDERYGFGPEHITIPGYTKEGTYTLYVHYYQNHNFTYMPTDVFVDVTTLNSNGLCVGPIKLKTPRFGSDSNMIGDLVKVCEITFPEGKIKVLNEKVLLLKSASTDCPQK